MKRYFEYLSFLPHYDIFHVLTTAIVVSLSKLILLV